MSVCIKCVFEERGLSEGPHPWCDDGTWNEKADPQDWAMPNWHRDENGDIIR